MLLPSLCALHADKLVPENLKIVCTARSDYSDESFRDFAAQALDKFLPEHRKPAIESFLERLFYQPLDANDTTHFHALARRWAKWSMVWRSSCPPPQPVRADHRGSGRQRPGQ
jgi:glucose-6-phosphate 1-dehydrogenase